MNVTPRGESDGVAMGSPLGVTFANFYMCHLENSVLDIQPNIKPIAYCRYIVDIFLIIKNIDKLTKLKDSFESNSVLKFTYELGTNNKINFLDVHVNITPRHH